MDILSWFSGHVIKDQDQTDGLYYKCCTLHLSSLLDIYWTLFNGFQLRVDNFYWFSCQKTFDIIFISYLKDEQEKIICWINKSAKDIISLFGFKQCWWEFKLSLATDSFCCFTNWMVPYIYMWWCSLEEGAYTCTIMFLKHALFFFSYKMKLERLNGRSSNEDMWNLRSFLTHDNYTSHYISDMWN